MTLKDRIAEALSSEAFGEAFQVKYNDGTAFERYGLTPQAIDRAAEIAAGVCVIRYSSELPTEAGYCLVRSVADKTQFMIQVYRTARGVLSYTVGDLMRGPGSDLVAVDWAGYEFARIPEPEDSNER